MSAGNSASAIRTQGLGKRFGSTWALEDCTIDVPRGPGHRTGRPQRSRQDNAAPPAGRTGRSQCRRRVGARTASGAVRGLPEQHRVPGPGRPPLSTTDRRRPLASRAHLNRNWDDTGARDRLTRLGIPLDRPVAKLSGGQRAQVGLGLALAKQPQILLLDEPVAALDPLARREFLASLTEAVADGDLSVVLSSHLLHDLERVCDHVILLASGHTQLCEEIETSSPRIACWSVPKRPLAGLEPSITVVKSTSTTNQLRLVARVDGPVLDPSWEVSELGSEDIILAYMGQDDYEVIRTSHGRGGCVMNQLIWRLHRGQAYFATGRPRRFCRDPSRHRSGDGRRLPPVPCHLRTHPELLQRPRPALQRRRCHLRHRESHDRGAPPVRTVLGCTAWSPRNSRTEPTTWYGRKE